MATETLEDNKPQSEPPLQGKNDDESAPEPDKNASEEPKPEPAPEEEQQQRQDIGNSQKEDSSEITKSEEKIVDDKGQASNQVEEEEKADEKKEEKEVEKDDEDAAEKEDEDDDEHDEDTEKEEEEDDEDAEAEAEIEEGKAKGGGKGRPKEGESDSKTPKKVSKKEDPVTPASDRPTRERKTVERYSIPSPAKSRRSSASKGFSIEKVCAFCFPYCFSRLLRNEVLLF